MVQALAAAVQRVRERERHAFGGQPLQAFRIEYGQKPVGHRFHKAGSQWSFGILGREEHVNASALPVAVRLCPDPTAVSFHDTPTDVQTESRAFGSSLARALRTRVALEQLPKVFGGNANPVIANEQV